MAAEIVAKSPSFASDGLPNRVMRGGIVRSMRNGFYLIEEPEPTSGVADRWIVVWIRLVNLSTALRHPNRPPWKTQTCTVFGVCVP